LTASKCFSATVFIPTAFIDNSNTGLKGKRHLTWREVRGLQAEGIEFGSHTANHPKLNSLKPEWIEHEIKSSKEIIEDKTGYQVKSFSNPYKFPEEDLGFIELLQACLQKAGYQNGVSTRIGTVHQKNEAFFLRRIPVNSDDDFSLLRAKLDGSYDWLSGFQTFYKRLTGTKKNNGIFSPPQTSNQPVTNKLLNGTK
jgi:peptidoglycan/xylan/chitin deacetylase (PgdA/CDA1 family)